MENNFMLTDELLWDYADGFLEGEEKGRVEAYLRQHPDQKARLDAILAEKRAFASLPLEKPKAGFSDQVLAAWSAEQALHAVKTPAKARAKRVDWVLWGIAAAFGLMLVVPVFFQTGTAPATVQWEIPSEYIPQVPSFDWAGFFDSAMVRFAVLFLLAFGTLRVLDKYLQVRSSMQVAA